MCKLGSSMLAVMALSLFLAGAIPAQTQALYIASPPDRKIVRANLDVPTGTISKLGVAVDEINAGFLTLHPTLPILYAIAVDKVVATVDQQNNAAVVAFEINRQTGELSEVGKIGVGDRGSTHVMVAPNAGYLVTCHYGGSGTNLVSLEEDGTFAGSVSKIQHSGSSVHASRQRRHHPHGVAISRDSQFVFVADLGNDHVEVFKVTDNRALAKSGRWKAAPGSGPRHLVLHANGKWLYSINELKSTISVLELETDTGKLTHRQTVNTLPGSFQGNNTTAEIVIHPNGKYLYGSNRGHDSTAVFAISPSSGKLSPVQTISTGGNHPRFVGLDPTGKTYLAANMNSHEIVSFSVDAKTGKLKLTGHRLSVKRPMCVAFFPLHEE